MSLKGKVAWITGGGSGIGESVKQIVNLLSSLT